MLATPPPAPPALVYSFEAISGYPGWQRLGVTVKCVGWTSGVYGLFVRKGQVAATKSLLVREQSRLRSDRCTKAQAEAALVHAQAALRARGIA